jgi:hypothetical protein
MAARGRAPGLGNGDRVLAGARYPTSITRRALVGEELVVEERREAEACRRGGLVEDVAAVHRPPPLPPRWPPCPLDWK